MSASVDQLRREREYTPDGALHYHVSVGPSGSVTIGPSQASFVPVRGKYRDQILDGGWPSVWEHFVGQIGQEMADGRYPADLPEITWRVAPRGGIVPMTDDARDGLPWVLAGVPAVRRRRAGVAAPGQAARQVTAPPLEHRHRLAAAGSLEGQRLPLSALTPRLFLTGRTPAWVRVVPPPRPQGRLPVPSAADLASLALRRCSAGTVTRTLAGRAFTSAPATVPNTSVPIQAPTSATIRASSSTRRSGATSAIAPPGHPLARHIDDFLTDLANANKPRNTIRAYRGDLIAFASHYDGEVAALTAAPVRAFLGEVAGQARRPASASARRSGRSAGGRSGTSCWNASPMDRIDAIEVPRTLPRPTAAADIAAVLAAICSRRPRKDVPLGVLRDRVLFETAYTCAAPRRCAGCTSRTWSRDWMTSTPASTGRAAPSAPCCWTTAATSRCSSSTWPGPGTPPARCLRASINGRGGPLSYDAAHSRWKKYCAAAGTGIGIHQLRHAHATELSTAASPSRSYAAASATRPPRPPRPTPGSPTRLPTPRSAPPAAGARPRAGEPGMARGSLGSQPASYGKPSQCASARYPW